MIAAVKTMKKIEFLRKEKFVGSALSLLEYLKINRELIYLRLNDKTNAPTTTPAITSPLPNVNHSIIMLLDFSKYNEISRQMTKIYNMQKI